MANPRNIAVIGLMDFRVDGGGENVSGKARAVARPFEVMRAIGKCRAYFGT
jgi:hypothetical protein